jgi:hypothetical protein
MINNVENPEGGKSLSLTKKTRECGVFCRWFPDQNCPASSRNNDSLPAFTDALNE